MLPGKWTSPGVELTDIEAVVEVGAVVAVVVGGGVVEDAVSSVGADWAIATKQRTETTNVILY